MAKNETKRLVATGRMDYGRERLEKGDAFTADAKHADVFIQVGKATLAKKDPATKPLKPGPAEVARNGTYQTRVMTAANTSALTGQAAAASGAGAAPDATQSQGNGAPASGTAVSATTTADMAGKPRGGANGTDSGNRE